MTIPATISINHNVAFGLEEQELYSSLRLKFAPRNNNVETTLKIKKLNKYHFKVIDTATYPCELIKYCSFYFTNPFISCYGNLPTILFFIILFLMNWLLRGALFYKLADVIYQRINSITNNQFNDKLRANDCHTWMLLASSQGSAHESRQFYVPLC